MPLNFLKFQVIFAALEVVLKYTVTDNASHLAFIQPTVDDKVNITNHRLQEHCSSKQILWRFIPQYSPWQGGAYKRLIGHFP